MHIEYYKEFIVLAKLLNYSAAAEQLFITQPVLSRHIMALETHIGVSLFDRSTQSVKLTKEGEALFRHMPDILEKYDELLDNIRRNQNNESLFITIGVPYYAINDYLQNVSSIIETRYPNVQLRFVTDDPNELIYYVFSNKTDIIIVPNIPFSGAKKLEFIDLFEERLGILCNIESPMAGLREIDITGIQGQRILSVDNNYFETMWGIITGICEDHGFSPPAPKLLNQMESVLIEIGGGAGISIVGRHMRSMTMHNVVFVPFANPECKRKVSICFKGENKNPAIPILCRAFRNVVY